MALSPKTKAKFNAIMHPRYPKGHPNAGKFMKKGGVDYKAAVSKRIGKAKNVLPKDPKKAMSSLENENLRSYTKIANERQRASESLDIAKHEFKKGRISEAELKQAEQNLADKTKEFDLKEKRRNALWDIVQGKKSKQKRLVGGNVIAKRLQLKKAKALELELKKAKELKKTKALELEAKKAKILELKRARADQLAFKELKARLLKSKDWDDRKSAVYDWVKNNRDKNKQPAIAHGMRTYETLESVTFGGIKYRFPRLKSPDDPVIATINSILDRNLPNELTRHTKEIIFTKQSNNNDAYWEKMYRMPNFKSGATGGDGRIVVYSGRGADSYMIAHEMGHNLAKARYNSTHPSPNSEFAKIPSSEPPVSLYGTKSLSEDFAEAVAAYIASPADLKRSAPQRFEVIKKLIKDKNYAG